MSLKILLKLYFDSPNKLNIANPNFMDRVVIPTDFYIDEDSVSTKSFYPSDETLSELASAVYDDHPSVQGWTLLTTAFNEGDGYFGAAFLSAHHRQLVIAHRGTNKKTVKSLVTDVLADIEGITRNQFIPRMNSASTFAFRVLEKLPPEALFSVSITGHSLGAWLAQISAFTLQYLTIKNNKFCRRNRNVDKFHAHTVGFESPGSKPMLVKLAQHFYFQYQTPPETLLSKLDITNYLTLPNRINCCHEQVGELRQIVIENLESGNSIEFLRELKYLAHYHSMQNIVDAMKIQENHNETEVGKGTRLKVLVWPSSRWPERSVSNDRIPVKFLNDIYACMKLCGQALLLFFDVYVAKSASTELKNDHKQLKKPIDEAEKDALCVYGISSKFEVEKMNESRCSCNVFTETEHAFLSNWLLLTKEQKVKFNIDCNVRENVSLESYMGLLPNVFIHENERLIECESKLSVNKVVNLVKFLFKSLSPAEAQKLNKDLAEKLKTGFVICGNKSKINVREMEKYDLRFEDTLDLKAFLKSRNEKILVVKCVERSVLELNRIYGVLRSELSPEKYMFLSWEQIRRLNDLIYLKSTFESINDENFLLVLDCRNEMDENEARLLKSLMENLLCKLVLVINSDSEMLEEENNNEAIKFVNSQLKFSNLSSESKTRLNETLIMPDVGDEKCSLRLEQLIDDEEKNELSLKTIEKLSENDVKLENFNFKLENFHNFFVEVNEIVEVNKFKETISAKNSDSIFIVSEKNDENNEDLIEIFNEEAMINEGNLILCIEKDENIISEKFNDLCGKNNNSKIFWLELIDSQSLNLRQVYRRNLYTPIKLHKNTKLNKKSFFEFSAKSKTQDKFIFAINCVTQQQQQSSEKIEIKKQEHFASYFDLDSILSKSLKKQFSKKFDKSIFCLDENEARLKFDQLSNEKTCVHWVKVLGKSELYWHKSHGEVHMLTEHLEHDESESRSELGTQNLISERFVVICDEPGMGKSTSLSKFSEDLAADSWVIHLDLSSHQPQLQSLELTNLNQIVSLIVDTINAEFKNLFKQILLCSLKKSQFKKIAFFFDGFDELNKNGREKMLNILKILKEETLSKIWITTRYEHKNVLEDCLSVLSVKFIKFSKDKQIEYLVKFWRCCLHFHGIKDHLLERYANEVLVAAENSLGQEIPNFLGNPLHMRMIAEVVWSLLKRQMSSQCQSLELDQNFKFQNFFQQFVKIKYDTYVKRQDVTRCDKFVAYSVRAMLQKHFRDAAVRLLFPAEAEDIFGIEDVKATEEVTSGLVKVGLVVVHSTIQPQQPQMPQFIYRVLAEYFVVDFLFYWLNKFRNRHRKFESAANFLINTILLEKEHRIIRQFINYILSSDFEKYKYILTVDKI